MTFSKNKIAFINTKALIKLFFIDFIRNPLNIFFALVYPLLLYAILSQVVPTPPHSKLPNETIYFGGIFFSTLFYVGCNMTCSCLVNLKQSTLLLSIKVTTIKIWQILFALIFVYALFAILTSTLIWIWPYVFSAKNPSGLKINIDNFNFGYYFLSIIIFTFFSICCGIFLASFIKNYSSSVVIPLMIYLVSAFLAGQFLPVRLIDGSSLKIVSWIFPQRHLYDLFMLGLVGNNVYNHVAWDNQFWSVWVYPLLFTLGLFTLDCFTFKIYKR